MRFLLCYQMYHCLKVFLLLTLVSKSTSFFLESSRKTAQKTRCVSIGSIDAPASRLTRLGKTRHGILASSQSEIVKERIIPHSSPLPYSIEELANISGGSGRARLIWEYYQRGVDPLNETERQAFSADIEKQGRKLGRHTLSRLCTFFGGPVEETIATAVHESVAADGTTKLLLQLVDGLQVETVIIPWDERQRSTLCVSSQVGCRQACTFCLTGRMGILRSLSADEILVQVLLAKRACRENNIYPIDNIVFMGMGEPADNTDAVVRAANVLTHQQQFQLTPRRITISTVAPSPDAFLKLGKAPVALAWSVHASREAVRRELVPTTKYTMEELREGYIKALLDRSRSMRTTMLEVTLLDKINDSLEDAEHLADFCQPLLKSVPGIKLVVNLIPWNDISASFGPASVYRKPTTERIGEFQKALIGRGILCYVRTTRGDDEGAACGQLATTNKVKHK